MSDNRAPEGWTICWQPNPRARLRLFCFPYAGGSASFYRTWGKALPSSIEVHAIELPGRGSRHREPPFTRMAPLVSALGQALRPLLTGAFAFFGHSVGSVMAFELARLLRREGRPGPVQLFASAHRAPHLPDRDPPLHALPRNELIEELRRLNGTPRAALESEELMDLVIPFLRADFAVNETYSYVEEPPLDIPITALGGLEDERVLRFEHDGWRQHTSGRFRVRLFPGDHFYVPGVQSQLLSALIADLGLAAQPEPFP